MRKRLLKILSIALLSSSEEKEELIYSSQWVKNIKKMTNQQFLDSFRLSRECHKKLLKFLKEHTMTIRNIDLKLYLFLFFIGHILF